MVEPNDGDVAFACASLLVEELVRGGVVGASISPGSRSAPIALALARHGGIPVHVHLDERSSGFFALGLAKVTGRPAVVACTSGTAVANLFPAVVEAFHAEVPLILLTADRPPELRGTGANQTIDQLEIFGTFTRWFVDAEVPEATLDASRYWHSLGARAIGAAVGPPAGPVHVNLPFREPLVPTGAPVDLGTERGAPERTVAAAAAPDNRSTQLLAELLGAAERGVVLAGTLAGPSAAISKLAAAAAWPLIAEPTSGLRTPGHALAAGQHLLADESFVSAVAPEVVLQFGAPPTGRATQGLVARAKRLVVAAPDPRGSDPSGTASLAIAGEPDAMARAALHRMPPRAETGWLRRWRGADETAAAAVGSFLDQLDEPFEGRVARDLAAWLPDGSVLVVGSSTPVRDLDAYMLPREGIRVLGNRGASGIDGFVSTVLGVSAAGSQTYALAGDLSLLHDVGALVWSARRGYDAMFVVPNNRGGGVFDLLSQASLPEHEALFVTPHDTDLEALASAAGAQYLGADRAADLIPALEKLARPSGISTIEIPIDRALAIQRRREVREVVRKALGD